jgi:hypothetical protein
MGVSVSHTQGMDDMLSNVNSSTTTKGDQFTLFQRKIAHWPQVWGLLPPAYVIQFARSATPNPPFPPGRARARALEDGLVNSI